MQMNKQVLDYVGVTEKEYREWCKLKRKKFYLTKTKKEFFREIQLGHIYRDSETNELKINNK